MESLAPQDVYISIMLIDSQYKPENKSKSAKSTRGLNFRKKVPASALSLLIL